MTAAMLDTVVPHHCSGSCSAQPGRGPKRMLLGDEALSSTAPETSTSADPGALRTDVDRDDALVNHAQLYPVSILTCLVFRYSSRP